MIQPPQDGESPPTPALGGPSTLSCSPHPTAPLPSPGVLGHHRVPGSPISDTPVPRARSRSGCCWGGGSTHLSQAQHWGPQNPNTSSCRDGGTGPWGQGELGTKGGAGVGERGTRGAGGAPGGGVMYPGDGGVDTEGQDARGVVFWHWGGGEGGTGWGSQPPTRAQRQPPHPACDPHIPMPQPVLCPVPHSVSPCPIACVRPPLTPKHAELPGTAVPMPPSPPNPAPLPTQAPRRDPQSRAEQAMSSDSTCWGHRHHLGTAGGGGCQ